MPWNEPSAIPRADSQPTDPSRPTHRWHFTTASPSHMLRREPRRDQLGLRGKLRLGDERGCAKGHNVLLRNDLPVARSAVHMAARCCACGQRTEGGRRPRMTSYHPALPSPSIPYGALHPDDAKVERKSKRLKHLHLRVSNRGLSKMA